MAWAHRTLKHSLNIYIKIVKQHAPKRRLPRWTKTSDFCCSTIKNKKRRRLEKPTPPYRRVKIRGGADVETSVTNSQTTRANATLASNHDGVNRKRTAATALSARTHSNPWRYYLPHREPHSWMDRTGGLLKKETEAGNHRSRNIMRIRNLTRTGIILALGTERLYLEPTRRSPAIVRWTQNTIGMRHNDCIP